VTAITLWNSEMQMLHAVLKPLMSCKFPGASSLPHAGWQHDWEGQQVSVSGVLVGGDGGHVQWPGSGHCQDAPSLQKLGMVGD